MEKRQMGLDIAKALAIFAVVLIHTENTAFAFIKETGVIAAIVAIDQVLRFSVPFFITVSGYLLAGKYFKVLPIRTFLKKRVFSLLPVYLLASGLIYFYLHNFSKEPQTPYNIFQILFLGKADYHLYFVPMLFQLYLLFPLLLYVYKKYRFLTLFGALTIQSCVFLFTFLVNSKVLDVPFNWGDQQQYVLSISWIFYFVLGIFLFDLKTQGKNIVRFGVLAVPFLLLGLVTCAFDGVSIFWSSKDVLLATGFTRFPVLLFASAFSVSLIVFSNKLVNFFGKASKFLSSVGSNSYHIYLIHTLIIRIILEYFKPKDFITFAVFILAVVYFSYLYSLIVFELGFFWRRLIAKIL